MRKIMVFLLVTGILLGMISVIEEASEEHVSGAYDTASCNEEGSGGGSPSEFNPVTCDGGGSGGDGGGIPG